MQKQHCVADKHPKSAVEDGACSHDSHRRDPTHLLLFQTKRDLAQARYNVLLGGLRLRQANRTLSQADLLQIYSLLAR